MNTFMRTLMLAVVFITGLYFVLQTPAPHDGALHIWDIKLADLKNIEVQSQNTSYTISRSQDTWAVNIKAASHQLDPKLLTGWLHFLLHPHAKSILDGEGNEISDLTPYGLVQPMAQIYLTDNKQQRYSLAVGHMTALKDNFYVRKADTKAVYLFSVYDLQNYLQGNLEKLKKKPSTEGPKDK